MKLDYFRLSIYTLTKNPNSLLTNKKALQNARLFFCAPAENYDISPPALTVLCSTSELSGSVPFKGSKNNKFYLRTKH